MTKLNFSPLLSIAINPDGGLTILALCSPTQQLIYTPEVLLTVYLKLFRYSFLLLLFIFNPFPPLIH